MHRGATVSFCCPMPGMSPAPACLQQAGFGAIATTSAGIAFTLGYPDGQRISREEMLGVVRRIAAASRFR